MRKVLEVRVAGTRWIGASIDQRVPAHIWHEAQGKIGPEQRICVDSLASGWVEESAQRIDLRAVEIVDGVGIGPIRDLVGRVLIGEGGVQTCLVGNIENGVNRGVCLQELIWVDGLP